MMKTQKASIQILSLLIMVLLTVSCSSDDGDENQAPGSFTLNEVTDGADLKPQLTWETATDPDGDDVSYQVYFDTENPPQITIANQLAISSFTIDNALELETTYYWKVIAKDTEGNTTESDIASFTTRDKTTAEAIVGKWFFDSVEGEGPLTACYKNSFILFTEDLLYQIVFYTEDNAGNCVKNGNETGTYKVNGNKLSIINDDGDGDTSIAVIESLTDTELVIDDHGTNNTFKKE